LGGFLEPIGPGTGVRGLFSADGVLLVRWASADLGLFSTFFAFLARFLPVFVPFFALFPSMSCAYLYVHNFRRTRVSRFGRENLAFDKETAEATGGNDEIRPCCRWAPITTTQLAPREPLEDSIVGCSRAVARGPPQAAKVYPPRLAAVAAATATARKSGCRKTLCSFPRSKLRCSTMGRTE